MLSVSGLGIRSGKMRAVTPNLLLKLLQGVVRLLGQVIESSMLDMIFRTMAIGQ